VAVGRSRRRGAAGRPSRLDRETPFKKGRGGMCRADRGVCEDVSEERRRRDGGEGEFEAAVGGGGRSSFREKDIGGTDASPCFCPSVSLSSGVEEVWRVSVTKRRDFPFGMAQSCRFGPASPAWPSQSARDPSSIAGAV
jgi:hypothetical protein